jgi:hypothetical protein
VSGHASLRIREDKKSGHPTSVRASPTKTKRGHLTFSSARFAPGNVMNLGQGFAVYATICKHTGRPFVFPGSPTLYNSLTDASDAGLIAEHHYWEVRDLLAVSGNAHVLKCVDAFGKFGPCCPRSKPLGSGWL